MAALEALTKPGRPGLMLALFLSFSVAAYIVWKITESPSQALQVTFNGLKRWRGLRPSCNGIYAGLQHSLVL